MSNADWFGCSMYMPLAMKRNARTAITKIGGNRTPERQGRATATNRDDQRNVAVGAFEMDLVGRARRVHGFQLPLQIR